MNIQSRRTAAATPTATLALSLLLSASSACAAQDATAEEALAQGAEATASAVTGLAATSAPTVEIVSVNGSGCPMGSATITNVAPDLSSFSVHFAGYAANRVRKNCMFVFNVPVPAGHTYTVTAVAASGQSNLGAGAAGIFGSYYYFQGSSGTATTEHVVTTTGPSAWTTLGAFDPEQYASCDASRYLVVNTSLRVSGDPSGASSISMDPDFTLKLTWGDCP